MGDSEGIGKRIQAARARAGMNKNQLARTLGSSWQQVDNWEKGKVEPSLTSVRRLSEVLEVSADYLLGLRDAPARDERTSLDVFLSELAPGDLTEHEAGWLRDAPVHHAHLSPEDYAQLLEDLRGMATRSTPAKSGPRPKVDRAAIEAKIAADKK